MEDAQEHEEARAKKKTKKTRLAIRQHLCGRTCRVDRLPRNEAARREAEAEPHEEETRASREPSTIFHSVHLLVEFLFRLFLALGVQLQHIKSGLL